MPLLIALAMLCVVLGGMALQKNRRCREVVLRGRKYQALQSLNGRYRFHMEVPAVLYIKEQVRTKAKYDRYDFDAALDSYLLDNRTTVLDYLKKIHANRAADEDYTHAVVEIMEGPSDVVLPKGVTFEAYDKIERKLCRELVAMPPKTIRVECEASYCSPKGKNRYKQERLYEFEAVQSHYEQALAREALGQTVQAQRQRERAKMTASMRYDVLKRDHFRCQICGATQSDGVKLHVDHIIPVSKGGMTRMENLRTLCEDCNLGKSNKDEGF